MLCQSRILCLLCRNVPYTVVKLLDFLCCTDAALFELPAAKCILIFCVLLLVKLRIKCSHFSFISILLWAMSFILYKKSKHTQFQFIQTPDKQMLMKQRKKQAASHKERHVKSFCVKLRSNHGLCSGLYKHTRFQTLEKQTSIFHLML